VVGAATVAAGSCQPQPCLCKRKQCWKFEFGALDTALQLSHSIRQALTSVQVAPLGGAVKAVHTEHAA
jgi:hypothetical protein